MKPTILVIDDDPMVCHHVKLALSTTQKWETEAVTDSLEGLRRAQESPPQLIVLDLMMPGMDGLEFLRQLRADQRTAEIPVLILTARALDDYRQSAAELGANAYLTKPYRWSDLMDLVKSLLGEEGSA